MLFSYSAFHCFHVWHIFGMIVLSRRSKYFVMWVKPCLRLVCAIPHIPQPRHLQEHKGSLVWVIGLPNSCKALSWLSDVAWKDLVLLEWALQRNVSTAGEHTPFHGTRPMWWESCYAQLWFDLMSSREVQIPWCYRVLCLLVSAHINPEYSSIKSGWLLFRLQNIWTEHLKEAVWT